MAKNSAQAMRISLLLCISILSSVCLFGQDDENTSGRTKKVVDRLDDKIVLEITNDMWLDLPDGVELKSPSLGFKGYFFTDYTFGQESNISFAWGFGISADNVHSNAELVQEEYPNGDVGDQKLVPFDENYEYEKNKFVTTYLELPIEFRYIAKGKHPFKFAAGFRVGFLLANHQKIIDTDGKRKYFDFDEVTKFRYGISGRIGVGIVQITGFYSLVPLLENSTGIIPVSIGLAFTPIK